MHTLLSHVAKKTLAITLVLIFILTPIASLPREAFAQRAVIVTGGNGTVQETISAVKNTITAAASSVSATTLQSLGLKEWALDGVLFALAKKVLQGIVRSTIAWINSGFKGSPMFVTDPGQFLLNIADEEAGKIIYGSDLKFLCSPINVRIALDFYYRSSRNRPPIQCTLSSVIGNVDSFMQGNFLSGGWPGWLAVSLNPTNSLLGGAFAGEARINSSITGTHSINLTEWLWGKGFLGKKSCTPTPDGGESCVTVTPGETISQALTFQLNSGPMTLIEADEINELIGALFAQLVQQGLTAASGIFGLSNSDSGYSGGDFSSGSGLSGSAGNLGTAICNGRSYLDQLGDPRCNATIGSGYGFASTTDDDFIEKSIGEERVFQNMQKRIISYANETILEAQDRGATCRVNDGVIRSVERIRATASTTLLASLKNEQELTLLKIKSAGTDQEKVGAFNSYNELMQSGKLHTTITNASDRFTTDSTVEEIQSLRSTIEDCPRRDRDSDSGGNQS